MRLLRSAVLALAVFSAAPGFAQDVPRKMTYQGKLSRSDGAPETQPQDLKFALYSQPTGGAPLWQETQSQVPLANGYYAVVLGKTTALPASVFTGQDLYLGLSVGTGAELSPRIQVASVPYALKASDSFTLEGKAAADFALVSHSHPNATGSASGFMSSADKSRFDQIPFDLSGNGLQQIGTGAGSVLRVDFNAVAAKNHTHALVCHYRSATGSESNGVTAFCGATETLMGGGCDDLDGPGGLQLDLSSKPVGVTVEASVTGGTVGHSCRSAATGDTVTAWAYCCELQ